MENTKVGIYLRLSRDDVDSSESNSISNQRVVLKKYVNSQEFELIDEYVDDGYSGANFDRPSFQRMLRDIKSEKINTVIVKDLSRFGRDYIESGKYIQKLFPKLGIRFIALEDKYDSLTSNFTEKNVFLPIKNFINESYCRDTSVKVRSAKEAKMSECQYIGSFAPYGYKKSLVDKYQLEVDKNVMHIIQKIFDMKIEGYSSSAIASKLNDSGFIPPARYKEANDINYDCGLLVSEGKWSSKQINRILSNKVYIGTLEQGKRKKINYKSKKEIIIDSENWITFENAHDSIVDKSLYIIANRFLNRDLYTRNKPYLLTGMVYCKDCKRQMIRRKIKNKNGDKYIYICASYNLGDNCTMHKIEEKLLLKLLQETIYNNLNYNSIINDTLLTEDSRKSKCYIKLEEMNKEKNKYEKLRKSLYKDYEEKVISENEYEKLRSMYLNKIQDINNQEKNERMKIFEVENKISNKDFKGIKKMFNINDRFELVSVVDKIYISEDKNIDILFNNFDDIDLIKNLTNINQCELEVI